tara:strand:- start:62 stop:874 length:813 start_codon:yes stop_codon:yes gene_type:complete
MANGFLSQIAASRAGGRASGGLAGLQIRRTGLAEMRTIEDEIRTMEEKLAEEEESARKREGRRGRGRLAGALLGGGLAALTGGGSLLFTAAGAGLGSAAGQELGARGFGTAAGIGSRKRYLDKIRSGLAANEGMFHQGARKDVDLKRSKINQFLRDADRQFNDSILASSISDAMTAFQVHSFAQGGGFKNMFGKKPTASQLATNSTVGSGSSLAAGTLDKATKNILEDFTFNKGFYGAGGGATSYNSIVNPSTFGGTNMSRGLYNLMLPK